MISTPSNLARTWHICYTKKAKWMSQQSEDDTERRSAVSTTCFHDNSLAGPPPPWLVCNESSALEVWRHSHQHV
ncbi:hypothetical protein ILYODFUR_027824 [Ilyodon furcidens]|uniref:Uncharacterized protein n=1 Tax=Ilyodon furcidens TaxID=33524 RepID=A0ABV0T0S5_9TELE